jgi:hypothetical protein
MHYRFLVTFDMKHAPDSNQARNYVLDELYENHFCCEGRWARSIADWFAIGGRWSGELSRYSWAKDITVRMRKIEKEYDVQVWGAFYGDDAKKKKQAELLAQFTQMWQDAAPPEYKDIPYQRDTYKTDGYADDAMVLTAELYDGLLRQYEGREDSEHHADLDFEPVSPEMIDKKWVVVVDYHA